MDKRRRKKINRYLIPLILTSLVPLILYYYLFDTKLDAYPWSGSEWQVDLFLFYKMVAVIVLGIVMAIGIGARYIGIRSSSMSSARRQEALEGFTSVKIWIPLMVYALLSILSTVFSKYRYWGLQGMAQQMEPLWALLAYLIIAYYACVVLSSTEDIRLVIRWFLAGSTLVGIIGAFQALGLDFYRSAIGKYTYLPPSLVDGDMEFIFEKGRTYASLYNPNYVGVFVSLILPILLVLAGSHVGKRVFWAYLLLIALLLMCLFGSASKAGILCVGLSVPALAILFRDRLFRDKRILLGGAILLGVAMLGIGLWKGQSLVSGFSAALRFTQAEEPRLSRVETNEDNVTLVYNGNKLIYRYHPGAEPIQNRLELKDEEGKDLLVTEINDATLAIQDERFPGFTAGLAIYEDRYYVNFGIEGQSWYFTNQTEDGTYYYLTFTGKLDKIAPPPADGFWKGKETFASNRGYIWSRTMPLLKDYLLLGSGPDSFLLVYPNDEYVGKHNYGYGVQNISKPHSLYLQTAVQTGMLSLIAFLIFYLMYLIQSIKLYLHGGLESYEARLGAAILVSTMAYMVAGLTNDSSITVAPLFWMLIGMGIAINRRIGKKKLQGVTAL